MNKFRVGSVEVLPQHNKIITNSQEIRLEPKIMQVLVHLILHKGQVLSREQIIQSLWPEQVVGDEVITRAVFELRKHFDDDPKQPQFIETIPRKGYSFVHDYEVIELIPKKVAKSVLLPISLMIIVCAVVWFTASLMSSAENKAPQGNQHNIETLLLEDSAERIFDNQLSPDKSRVIYVRQQNDFWLLKTIDLNTLHKSVLVESKLPIRSPQWLSETSILYIRCTDKRCEIVEKNLAANKQQVLHRTPKRLIQVAIDKINQRLVMEFATKKGRYLQLYNLKTQQELEIIELPDRRVSKPSFSNDGQSLFFISANKNENPKIYQWHLAQKKLLHTISAFNRIFGYAEIDNHRILVAGRKAGGTGIWAVDLIQQSTRLLSSSAIGEFILSVNAQGDGNRWIASSVKRNIDSYSTHKIELLARMNSSMIDMNTIWDNVNNRLFYVSNRSGSYELWQTDQLGSRKLTALNTNVIKRPILSKDSSTLAFVSPLKSKSQIHIVDLNNQLPIQSVELPGEVQLLSWSSDNQHLYYSAYERKNYHIFKYSIEKQLSEPVLVSAGFMLHEDSETGDLYYIDTQEKRLMRKSAGGEIEQLSSTLNSAQRLSPLQAVVDNGALYYIAANDGLPVLTKYDIATASYETLETLPARAFVTQIVKYKGNWVAIYDRVHPDKSRLYQSTIVQ
ncbi:winged helix-turn-helix domain-containing protein [Psychrobium sp. 1_MG-2023]|uniref:winged helix-turn-helix domain-containing protein n=1 Tax=Psychrobium sp. 1_MG-2023 TaxID=3062624 RepID=UPI000C34A0F4|nr:winged helix-turn-helix domain-containing protein [Psychrobium sp. 1_MG-2023]MDP2561372.1 winged helix-turn-helix domain-containing protein [Psychrobium sp. 1_MG-2023]PKF54853.1 hypothetical protein CW748_15000 [Alteromonadales bacterium alter-6D02]